MVKRIKLVDLASELKGVSRSGLTDIKHLVSYVLGVKSSSLGLVVDLNTAQLHKLNSFMKRRIKGEPVAYILGEWDFWGMCLKLNKYTLIPRADTEVLVETVLLHNFKDDAKKVVDCGTGCGAIALALAKERPLWHIEGVDFCKEAVLCAVENQENLKISKKNLVFRHENWERVLVGGVGYDIIVSNPPYIDKDDLDIDKHVHEFEPHDALYSSEGGVSALDSIIRMGRFSLNQGGRVYVEHGWRQGELVRNIFLKYGYSFVETVLDLSGSPRVSFASL